METKIPRVDDKFLISSVSYWSEIYDSSHEHYRNQNILYRVWKEVGRDMSYRHDNAIPVSGLECRQRWKSLVSAYAHALKQEATQQVKGGRKRKQWPHFDSMSFLKPFLLTPVKNSKKQKTTASNPDSPTNAISSDKSTAIDNVELVDVPEIKFTPVEEAQFITEVASESVDDSIALDACEGDMFSLFKSLMPDIQKLTPKRQRKFKLSIHRELNALIDEQEEEESTCRPVV